MKICPICKQEINDPKHPRRKYCSMECWKKAVHNPQMDARACEICGEMFQPYRPSQRFCSPQCFGKSIRYPPHICETCGKEFPYVKGSKNRFCSYKCAQIGSRDRIQLTCEVCGTPFEVTRYRYEHNNTRFCSRKCKSEAGHALLTCRYCKKIVKVRKHVVESGKYAGFCSYECAAAWQKGENHSNWQGGHEKWRGPNWKAQRRKARKRDGYTCQECGITEKELGRPLDVHHIVSWRAFDNDWKRANQLSNLVSYCPHCHTTVERS